MESSESQPRRRGGVARLGFPLLELDFLGLQLWLVLPCTGFSCQPVTAAWHKGVVASAGNTPAWSRRGLEVPAAEASWLPGMLARKTALVLLLVRQ